jgi:hypothetical protein
MDFFGGGGDVWGECDAHKTPSYETKMLLKFVFDKTAFVKFNISNNFKQTLKKHIQNNQKSIGKSIPAYGF